MNRLLKSALIEMRGEGIELDPVADLDHILILDRLARKVTDPELASDASTLLPVRKVGNIQLRRLSIGAQYFVSEIVLEWIPDDVVLQDLAYVYCMCHEPEDLWPLQYDRSAFLKAVKRWAKTITVSMEEVRLAVQAFLAAPRDESLQEKAILTAGDYRRALGILGKLKPLPEAYALECEAALTGMEVTETTGGYGALVEKLVRIYGNTPEYWLWRTSAKEINVLLAECREREEAEVRAMRGHGDDRLTKAHHAFCEYKALVVRLKKGAK